MLIKAAETLCKKHGCSQIRLELLTPAHYSHPEKVWLDKWYRSLGYIKGQPEDFGAHFPHIASLFAVECVLTPYMKKLS